MWPTKNTAFIVIHGIGAHRPFATVDAFARGFWNVLQKENPGLEIKWQHKLLRHENWIENYVSLVAENRPTLDFYEYYWDCYMVREITSKELLKWLEQLSKGAQKFYTDNPEIAARHRQSGIDLFRDDDLRYLNYVYPILRNIWWLKWLGPLLKYVPAVGPAMKILSPTISSWMYDFMQDIVIYTSSDVRSQSYAIRQQILNGAVAEIRLLLEKRNCQIVLAGHSLGSVIAYDALNRIILDMNTDGGLPPKLSSSELSSRIGGLVTFGSPLDKIYFFFQEPTAREQYVQRQILSHFHSYKRLPVKEEDGVRIETPVTPFLDKSPWLNFYHPDDLVSGHLDAYKVDRNTRCEYEPGVSGAHSGYWTYDKMYRDIAKQYF